MRTPETVTPESIKFDKQLKEKIMADVADRIRASKLEITPDIFVDVVCRAAYLAGFRSACEVWRASQ